MTTNIATCEDAASEGAPDATGDRRELVILGVGSAAPRAAAALSKALDLPIETVVDAVYRDPARLLANLRQVDAERLVEMIGDLGLVAAALPPGQLPQRGAAFDTRSRGRAVDGAGGHATAVNVGAAATPAAVAGTATTGDGTTFAADSPEAFAFNHAADEDLADLKRRIATTGWPIRRQSAMRFRRTCRRRHRRKSSPRCVPAKARPPSLRKTSRTLSIALSSSSLTVSLMPSR